MLLQDCERFLQRGNTRCLFFKRIERSAQVIQRIRKILDRPRQRSTSGVRMASTVQFLGDFQRVAIAAPQTNNHQPVPFSMESEQN